MRLLIFLPVLLLTGCVSIYTASQPYDVKPVSTMPCPEYAPPPRHPVPEGPELPVHGNDYTKFLEELSERLVRHVMELNGYIDREHADEDHALRSHQAACQKL